MELQLERTLNTALVGDLPVALWRVMGGDGVELGIAFIAEIIAVPPVYVLSADMTRRMLAMELAEPHATIRVQPTDKIIEANGAPARLWLGRSSKGLMIGAFICTIAASDPDLKALLEVELRSVDVRTVLDELAVPDADVTRLLSTDQALR
jgi:hypothetical protein